MRIKRIKKSRSCRCLNPNRHCQLVLFAFPNVSVVYRRLSLNSRQLLQGHLTENLLVEVRLVRNRQGAAGRVVDVVRVDGRRRLARAGKVRVLVADVTTVA